MSTLIVFILLTILLVGYLLFYLILGKRIYYLAEVVYIIAYINVGIFLVFPDLLFLVDSLFSITNLLLFGSLFLIYILFIIAIALYHQNEYLRVDLTKLTQELAFMKHEIKVEKKKRDTSNSGKKAK